MPRAPSWHLRAALSALALLSSCAAPVSPPSRPSRAAPPPLAVSTPGPGQLAYEFPPVPGARLALVHAGALQGQLVAVRQGEAGGGGLARRAAYLAELRRSSPDLPLLHFETGDSFDGRPERVAALLAALERMGIDAYNVGGRELEPSLGVFVSIARRSAIPFVSTNLVLAGGGAVVPPYRLIRVATPGGGALRVLVLGVGDWGPRGPAAVGWADFERAGPAVERTLRPLRGVADLTVLLAAGFDPRRLACALENVRGIDLILLGTEGLEPGRTLMGTCNQTVSLGGSHGLWLTDLHLVPADGGWRLAPRTVALSHLLPEAPEIAGRLAAVPAYDAAYTLPRMPELMQMGTGPGLPGTEPAPAIPRRSAPVTPR